MNNVDAHGFRVEAYSDHELGKAQLNRWRHEDPIVAAEHQSIVGNDDRIRRVSYVEDAEIGTIESPTKEKPGTRTTAVARHKERARRAAPTT